VGVGVKKNIQSFVPTQSERYFERWYILACNIAISAFHAPIEPVLSFRTPLYHSWFVSWLGDF
jgi:hypothetical protein